MKRLFDWFENILFKQLGVKFHTNKLKGPMDAFFIYVETIMSRFDNLVPLYLNGYLEVVEKEIILASLSSNDAILVIGGGSIPATSILLAQKTGAHVLSIDCDAKAIQRANALTKRLKLDHLLQFSHAMGETYPVGPFDTVYILYGVRDPLEVLRHIATSGKPKVQVIIRTVADGTELQNSIEKETPFHVAGTTMSTSLGPLLSLLLKQKTS